MRRRVVAAPVVAAVALVVALTAVLLRSDFHSAGDNAKPINIGVVVPGGHTFCQPNNVFPADASRLRVWVSTAGEPGHPLNVRIRQGARTVATGHARGGYVDSPVTIPLERRVVRDVRGATVCIELDGPSQAAFMGDYAGVEAPARAGTAAQPQVLDVPGTAPATIKGIPQSEQQGITARFEFLRSQPESWLDLAPAIIARASYGRPGFFGEWTIVALLAAMLCAAVGAIVLIARQALRG